MPLDQATAAFVAMVAKVRTKSITEMTPVEVREGMAKMRALFGQGPEMHRIEPVIIGSGPDAIEARLLVPEADVQGLIVYFHGGGWVTGHIDDFDVLGRKLAQRSRCAVLLVNYRLAPEHPFPAAVHDAIAALQWAAANASHIAGRPLPLILAGDSAGANLATVAASHARDQAGPAVAMQILVYPATDANFERSSYRDPDLQMLLNRDIMCWYWDHYQPDSAQRSHPHASPLQADSLTGLPPTLLITAEYDPLRDEGEAYAARLVSAGVPLTFKRYAGQVHGFFSMVNVLPASEAALDQVARFIQDQLPH